MSKTYLCKCPVHGGEAQDLEVYESDEGWVVFVCSRNCRQKTILLRLQKMLNSKPGPEQEPDA